MDIAQEEVDQELKEWWTACMDGHECKPPALAVIRFAEKIGLLTEEQAEMWTLRIEHKCPEADRHLGGRAWCAYCGTLRENKPA